MRIVNMRFEDKEFKILEKAKCKTPYTWEGFILDLIKGGKHGRK